MPVLPFIEDTEENVVGIVRRAYECGARFIYPAFGVTLRQNQRDWFYDKLGETFPCVKEKYIAAFGSTYECHCRIIRNYGKSSAASARTTELSIKWTK